MRRRRRKNPPALLVGLLALGAVAAIAAVAKSGPKLSNVHPVTKQPMPPGTAWQDNGDGSGQVVSVAPSTVVVSAPAPASTLPSMVQATQFMAPSTLSDGGIHAPRYIR